MSFVNYDGLDNVVHHGGLNHDFYLIYTEDGAVLERGEFSSFIGPAFSQSKNGLSRIVAQECVYDEIINYFMEFLMWIPSRNTWADGRDRGINRWGETVYHKDSAEPLIAMLSGIKSLFLNAPNHIRLRGYRSHLIEENDIKSCKWRHLFLSKERSLIKINHLLEMAEHFGSLIILFSTVEYNFRSSGLGEL